MGFLGEVIVHLLIQLTTACRNMLSKHCIKDELESQVKEQWAKWMHTACVVGPSVKVVISNPFDKYLFLLIIVKGPKRGVERMLATIEAHSRKV